MAFVSQGHSPLYLHPPRQGPAVTAAEELSSTSRGQLLTTNVPWQPSQVVLLHRSFPGPDSSQLAILKTCVLGGGEGRARSAVDSKRKGRRATGPWLIPPAPEPCASPGFWSSRCCISTPAGRAQLRKPSTELVFFHCGLKSYCLYKSEKKNHHCI